MFNLDKMQNGVGIFFDTTKSKITPEIMKKVVQDVGNEFVLDILIAIVQGGYSMSLGWRAKSRVTFKIYKWLKDKGYLVLEEGVTEDDWRKGLIKSGKFLRVVKEEKKKDHIQVEGTDISFILDIGKIEENLTYLKDVRADRDYHASLMKLMNEEFKSGKIKNKFRELIESITNIYIE